MQVLLKGFVDRDPMKVRSATQGFIDDAEQQYFLSSDDAV
jgi:hypothetical protein